jgi:hypothetical protein
MNLSFHEHLWDNLVTINAYNKRGLNKLKGMRDFGATLQKLVRQFTKGMRAAALQLISDMTETKGPEYEEYTTLTHAVTAVTRSIDLLTKQLDLSAKEMSLDLVDPLTNYTKRWQEE